MPFLDVLLIAVGLAMDATAVSLGVGTTGQASSPRPIFRLSFHFGLFQALMPILGWVAGSTVAGFISSVDHWLAFGLLAFVGGRMVKSGLDSEADPCPPNPSRGGTLILLCIATSIDAFAVGLSLAMLRVAIIYPSLVIGLVTALMSLAGLLLGGRLGERFGKRMEILGGLILIAIGLRVVLAHLLGW
ncbi:MAG TPA: manganese efflux pump MntP family protein [Anaerolineae bacterium]